MRICILTRGDLFPTDHGAAVKIVRTAQALSRAGAPTCIVTDDRDAYLRFEDGVHRAVPYPPRVRAAQEWPPLPRLGRIAESLTLRLGYPPEETFLYRPLFDPAWWGRALAVGRAERTDVFQAEFPGYGMPGLVAAAFLRAGSTRPRTAVVQHNVEWARLQEFGHRVSRIRRVEQGLLARVDDVIAVSDDDRRRMVAAGLDPARVTVIPHGVDVQRFRVARPAGIRARYGIPEDAPLLFFHGTLHYWPNTEAVAFIAQHLLPRLIAARPDARVLIVGRSPPRYYDHPAITFTGPLDDLPQAIAAADLCICPLRAGGGTRMKILEYLAAGKPVLSTTKGAEGIPIVDGRELCIADGVEAFASAALRLLDDPDGRARLGREAARFAERYDWSAVAEAYLSVYRGEGRGDDWNRRLEAGARRLPRRRPSKPLTMLLLINRGCNLRCTFCDLWSDPERLDVHRRLPGLLDEAAVIGTRAVVITGGEPLQHPELFAAVAMARARGMGVNITTNGTLVERNWEALLRDPPDSLSFSIDGLEATHDRLRGQRGAWRRTMRAAERVVAHGGIGVSIYMVVTAENVRELLAVRELALRLGVAFDFWPVNDAPEQYLRTPEDRAAWIDAIDTLAARDPTVAARRHNYHQALDYHDGRLGAVRCLGFTDQYGVTYRGDLLPCCVWGGDGLVVGNVFDTPLSRLWEQSAVRAFRERLEVEGCAAGCFNHSLYEYREATGASFHLGR